MDTKQLKQKILDLAIRGKLVPQDPNDEPASVLLERIRAEKEQLIAQGKLKKSKSKISDKPHYENVPFEIPETWEWCRLGEISNYGQTSHTDVNHIGKSDWILELEDIEKDSGRLIQKISRFERNISGVRSNFTKGTILYSKLRTYLNKVLVAPDNGYCTTEIIPFYCIGNINHFYIAHVLRSQYFIDYTELCCYGCKMPRLSTDDARKGFIPLPPLAEQQRIVAEVEKWFAIIDALEANKEDLKDYIKQVKSKVLALAISGKLVPQDPNDEPAIELLKRINPNFKPCDTSHYENLPAGWSVTALSHIIDLFDSKRKPIKAEERAKRIEGKDVLYPYYGATGFVGYIDEYLIEGKFLLLGEDGAPFLDPYAEKAYVVEGKFWVNNHAHILRPKIDFDYLKIYLNAFNYHDVAKGTTRLKLTQGDMNFILVTIPPLKEQRRISSFVENVFSLIDTISTEL